MITPRLIRRSLVHGFQWRFLVLWMAAMILPTLLAMLPVAGFLSGQLDHWPGAKGVVATMDGSTMVELLRQLGENGANSAIAGAMRGSFLVLVLLVTPALAGAAIAMARSDEALGFGALLRSAGENFGKMLRLALVSLVPLGVASGLAGGAFALATKLSEKAVTEASAMRHGRLATLFAALVLFVAQLTLDGARAHFAAQPERRSAWLAWWNGLKLLFRQPLKVLGLGAATSLAGLGLAALLMLLRLRIVQGGAGAVLLALVAAQLAVAAVGWYRASRVIGLAELVRAEQVERARRQSERFQMHPPVTSPPAPRLPAAPPLEALATAPSAHEPRAEALPDLQAELPPAPRATPMPPDTGLPLSEHVEAFPEQIEEVAPSGAAAPPPAAPAERGPGEAPKPAPSLSRPDGSGT